MTIAVGFRCTDGIVLAADREVSSSSAKFDAPKTWHYWYPRQKDENQAVLRVGIAGAGDYGFLKFASERIDAQVSAWIASHGTATHDEVMDAVQVVVSDLHLHHLYPFGQPHERPTIELLVAVWIKGVGVRLSRTSLTAITKVWNYEPVGIGSDLASFLVRRFYTDRIPLSSAMLWATYVLMHAKRYVPGCGSTSDVLVMFASDGHTGLLKQETIKGYEEFATRFEAAIHPLFMEGADPNVPHSFVRRVDEVANTLKTLHDPSFIQKQEVRAKLDVTLEGATIHSTAVLYPPSLGKADDDPSQPSNPTNSATDQT